MKKQTLLAASLLSAAAFSAAASDIQVYGVLDYGLTWQDRTNSDGSDSAALQMTSGQYIGSRFEMCIRDRHRALQKVRSRGRRY